MRKPVTRGNWPSPLIVAAPASAKDASPAEQQRYAAYVAYCRAVEVAPASFTRWWFLEKRVPEPLPMYWDGTK